MPAAPQVIPGEPDPARPQDAFRTWLALAWVAGLFALLVGAGIVVSRIAAQAHEVLNSPELAELKEDLRANPADESLKERIRELDLQLRARYFRQLARTESGVYLLLGGAVVFLLTAGRLVAYRTPLPMPQPNPGAAQQTARAVKLARWSVAACGMLIGAGLLALTLGMRTALPDRPEDLQKLFGAAGESSLAQAPDAASLEEYRRHWPRFRGPDGGGVSAFANVPVHWDAKSGAGIAWKTPVAAPGFNSPVVWGERIFLSGADAAKREVFCFDAKTGRLLWQQPVQNVPGSPARALEIPEETGYAASTMATDGRRVYAIFANGDLAAFTLDGRLVWSKHLGIPKNQYGHATSLATWQDRLIVQLDQGESEEGKSRLLALDGRTGQLVWQRQRKMPASWATPIVIEAAGKAQVITLGDPWLTAYAAGDGTEVWRADCLGGEITPSPVFADGLLFVVSPSDRLLAIRPDGRGDVTQTHIVWTSQANAPDITSPVSNGELVFALSTPGLLTCFDAKDGRKLWEHELETDFHASPGLAGSRLHLFGVKGAALIIEAGREYKELFRTQMDDSFHASPAFVQDKIVLRGVTNLWCIGPEPRLVQQAE